MEQFRMAAPRFKRLRKVNRYTKWLCSGAMLRARLRHVLKFVTLLDSDDKEGMRRKRKVRKLLKIGSIASFSDSSFSGITKPSSRSFFPVGIAVSAFGLQKACARSTHFRTTDVPRLVTAWPSM